MPTYLLLILALNYLNILINLYGKVYTTYGLNFNIYFHKSLTMLTLGYLLTFSFEASQI